MSSFTKMVSVFVLSGAACFATGCIGSADDGVDDESANDALQAEVGLGGLTDPALGAPALGGGQYSKYSKFSKKAPPPIEQPPVQQTPFSKFSKKAPPPMELPPVQQTPFSKYSQKSLPPIEQAPVPQAPFSKYSKKAPPIQQSPGIENPPFAQLPQQ